MLRILMLGNSLTSAHKMPEQIATITAAHVVAHVRGGARLAEQLNPATKLGAQTQAALTHEQWDFVVMQEMSNAAITSRDRFIDSAVKLSEQARAAGALPVIYATWAYASHAARLTTFAFNRKEMSLQMAEAFADAAQQSSAIVADVRAAFDMHAARETLYAPDGIHPSEAGAQLAAQVIAATLLEHCS